MWMLTIDRSLSEGITDAAQNLPLLQLPFQRNESTSMEHLSKLKWPMRFKIKHFNKNRDLVELRLTQTKEIQHEIMQLVQNHCAFCYHCQTTYGCKLCKVLLCKTPKKGSSDSRSCFDIGKNHCAFCYHHQTTYGCKLCKVLHCKTPKKGSSDSRSCFDIWHNTVDLLEERDKCCEDKAISDTRSCGSAKVETRNKQGTRGREQNKRKQKQQRRRIVVEVDKEDIPKTPVEEENNIQIQPYVREKSGSRDRIFWFDGKEYTSYSEMVQAKRERNRRVLLESGLLDTTKRLNALVGKTKSPEVHYYAEAASTGSGSGSDSNNEKEGTAIMTSTSMARLRRTNTDYGKGIYAKAASNSSGSDTEKQGTAIMSSTSMARPRRTNTNYGRGSFGREQLDFHSMTTESFTKSKLKGEGESFSTETEQEEESY
jgi:hypothetical protein